MKKESCFSGKKESTETIIPKVQRRLSVLVAFLSLPSVNFLFWDNLPLIEGKSREL